MNNKIISIILGAIVVTGVGTLVYTQKQSTYLSDNIQSNSSQKSNNTNTEKTPEVAVLSLEDEHEEEENDDNKKIATAPTQPSKTIPSVNTTQAPKGITMSEVATHNSRSNCWSVVNGNVYDLTSWIPNHPGGEGKILSMCGVDGSSGYNREHGGKSKPTAILAGFKLGALSK